MPEGDSVLRAVRRLDAATAGRVVVRSDIRVPAHAEDDLAGRRVLGWSAYGKHLLCRLGGGVTLRTHLGMDGSWSLLRPGRRLPQRVEHRLRVALALDDGRTAVGMSLREVALLRTADEEAGLAHLGPDVLAAGFDPAVAAERFRGQPDRPVKEALLDQRNVAGLGNLWANEVCFLRGLDPWRPVAEVDVEAALRLAARMMRQSVARPGAAQTTTGDRRDPHWVAGRYRQPCRRCGTPIRRAGEGAGPQQRVTWWCPACQPAAASGRAEGGEPQARTSGVGSR